MIIRDLLIFYTEIYGRCTLFEGFYISLESEEGSLRRCVRVDRSIVKVNPLVIRIVRFWVECQKEGFGREEPSKGLNHFQLRREGQRIRITEFNRSLKKVRKKVTTGRVVSYRLLFRVTRIKVLCST